MMLITMMTWAEYRALVLEFGVAVLKVHYMEQANYFECGALTTDGYGFKYAAETKPVGLTGFHVTFPNARLVDLITWL